MGKPVSASEAGVSERERLDQLAGFTGVGWTTSFVLFLVTTIYSGPGTVGHLVAEPAVFLYLGAVLFLTTLELDRLGARRSARRGVTPTPPSRRRGSPEDIAHQRSITSTRSSGCF